MEKYVEHQVKNKFEVFFKGAFKVIFMIIAAILFLLLFGYGFMLLWNWLMPEVFGLPSLSYWQGVGILVMAKLLFGNFEGHHKKQGKGKRKHFRNNNCDAWKKDISKWKFYDDFWKDEGEKAFDNYVNRNKEQNTL